MRASPLFSGILIAAACGGHPRAVARGPDTATAAEHHQAVAQPAERTGASAAGSYSCGIEVLDDQLAAGAERITTRVPCWDVAEEAEHARHEQSSLSADLTRARETHRGELAAAQLAQCKGIPARELTHSPFAHKRAIADVIPHRREGELHGVRIVFAPVPGLSADWMRQAIDCHRARYEALGKPASYLPDDPSLVEGVEVEVMQTGDVVQVFISTPQPAAGKAAFERANELLHPKSASR